MRVSLGAGIHGERILLSFSRGDVIDVDDGGCLKTVSEAIYHPVSCTILNSLLLMLRPINGLLYVPICILFIFARVCKTSSHGIPFPRTFSLSIAGSYVASSLSASTYFAATLDLIDHYPSIIGG